MLHQVLRMDLWVEFRRELEILSILDPQIYVFPKWWFRWMNPFKVRHVYRNDGNDDLKYDIPNVNCFI